MAEVGAMRHVIYIEQRSKITDASGEPLLQWDLVLRRHAEVVKTPGGEVFSSNEKQGRVPTVFRIRFPRSVEVLPEMRVRWKGKVFNILSAIDPDSLRVDLLITAELWVEAQP